VNGSITIFMYHDIYDNINPKYKRRYDLKSFLSVKQFETQLMHITTNYKVISSEQLYNLNIDNLEHDYAVLTFDDGLAGHYTNVLPLLVAYKVPGTFLIPGGPVLDRTMIHSHKIQFILSRVESEALLVNKIMNKLFFSKEEKDTLWDTFSVSKFRTNWWSKEMVFITNFLREYTNDKYTIVDELFEEFVTKDTKKFSEGFYLNLEEVLELTKAGMEIGGHGYSSENLLLMAPDDRNRDIQQSILFIKYMSNTNFIPFSYPNGAYNYDITRTLDINGCSVAFTTENTRIEQYNTVNYLEVPRFNTLSRL